MNDQAAVRHRKATTLAKLLPLAGVGYAVLTMAGNFTIGEFPDATSPVADLSRYYATHGGAVRLGGQLMILGALCLGLFGVAAYARVRETAESPMVAGLVLVGTAVAVTSDLSAGATYALLGSIGADGAVTPGALQAWQIGTELGGGGGTLLMLGLFAAGVFSRAIPAWLAWPALVLGIAEFTPVGFYASLLVLLWTAVAGITLSLRTPEPTATSPAAVAEPASA
jgi:hypothetical protein